MKMRNIKKKVFIFSLALAMAITSTSFAMLRIHGEVEVLKTGSKLKAIETKKAFLTASGTVTGRTESDTSNTTNISELDTITDLMIGDQVTSVEANKFKDLKNLTTLTFKAADSTSKVTSIGVNAFKGTNITSVTLPKALTSIEAGAFADTVALTSVNFANSTNLQHIKTGAFENSGLTTLNLSPMNTTTTLSVGERAFKGNRSLTSATLSSKMTVFEAEVFASTGLTSVNIGQNVTTVNANAFRGTPVGTLTVEEANTSFSAEGDVLYNNGKTKLLLYPEGKTGSDFTIPENVTTIESYAFSSSPSLTTLTTNAALMTIGEYAFDGASKLAKVELKDALTQIGQYAFRGTALVRIALHGKLAGIEANAFAGAASLTTLDLRKATALTSVKANAFKDSALNTMIIGKTTGTLSTIAPGAFSSTATSRRVSFLNDTNVAIRGEDLTTLVTKYQALKSADNGEWTFDAKLPTPEATADYDIMKIIGLVPNAAYTINAIDYTADAEGNVALLKKWGGQTLSIVRKAALGQEASDAQSLVVKGIYTVSVDGTQHAVKQVGALVSVTAPDRAGYVFTQWTTQDATLDNPRQKTVTFTMPDKDVHATMVYTEIVVETPGASLLFDGKNDVVVTLTSALSNFTKLAVNGEDLTKGTDYTVAGTETTVITLKKAYLDTLSDTTSFTATFIEGGDKQFSVRLYGTAPTAEANYKEMKITGLEADAQYKINGTVVTADAQGKVDIEKAWSAQTLELIKVGRGSELDSKPQRLDISTLYTIHVDGKELRFTAAGVQVSVTAEHKEGYIFNQWTATGVTLNDARKEDITFTMNASNVVLTTSYSEILITKAEDMVYNGTKEVTIRFAIPMEEFRDIEYNGHKLVKDVDYIVTSGSTIVTFTKTFLDNMKEGKNGMKAVFAKDSVAFSITLMAPIVPAEKPVLPEVTPTPATNPISPLVRPVPTKAEVKNYVKRPNTGDGSNRHFISIAMLLSTGVILIIKTRNKRSKTIVR